MARGTAACPGKRSRASRNIAALAHQRRRGQHLLGRRRGGVRGRRPVADDPPLRGRAPRAARARRPTSRSRALARARSAPARSARRCGGSSPRRSRRSRARAHVSTSGHHRLQEGERVGGLQHVGLRVAALLVHAHERLDAPPQRRPARPARQPRGDHVGAAVLVPAVVGGEPQSRAESHVASGSGNARSMSCVTAATWSASEAPRVELDAPSRACGSRWRACGWTSRTQSPARSTSALIAPPPAAPARRSARRRRSSRTSRSGTGCRRAPRRSPRRSGRAAPAAARCTVRTKPGVHQPHWKARAARNARCTGSSAVERLGGRDLAARGLRRERDAARDGLAVEQHGAGAADPDPARGPRRRQPLALEQRRAASRSARPRSRAGVPLRISCTFIAGRSPPAPARASSAARAARCRASRARCRSPPAPAAAPSPPARAPPPPRARSARA